MSKVDLRLTEPDCAEALKAMALERSCSTRLVLRLPNFRAKGSDTWECGGVVKGLARTCKASRDRRTLSLYIVERDQVQVSDGVYQDA